jgi:hypothetical protein
MCGNLPQSDRKPNSFGDTVKQTTKLLPSVTAKQTSKLLRSNRHRVIRVRVRVTFRLTVSQSVSQSVCLGVEPRPGLTTRYLCYSPVHMGRPL